MKDTVYTSGADPSHGDSDPDPDLGLGRNQNLTLDQDFKGFNSVPINSPVKWKTQCTADHDYKDRDPDLDLDTILTIIVLRGGGQMELYEQILV